MSTNDAGPILVGRVEVSRRLSISLRKLDQLVADKVIPSIKLGGRRLFDLESVRLAVLAHQSSSGGVS